jgi:GrpB-like predicted nucleotidyltransferase (UPF0157 family)
MSISIAVHLVDYDPAWPVRAAAYSEKLKPLEPVLLAVHHIGSTAVPGLSAKPVIDLSPIVTSIAELDVHEAEVKALGFGWHREFGVEGRRFCTLDDDNGDRLANLHFYANGSPHARRQIAFRDYLIAHPEVAADYAAEKRRARELYPDDSHAYSNEKGAWIRAVETKALAWVVGETH